MLLYDPSLSQGSEQLCLSVSANQNTSKGTLRAVSIFMWIAAVLREESSMLTTERMEIPRSQHTLEGRALPLDPSLTYKSIIHILQQ